MAHYAFLDDLIKEYLLFRGFTSTLKSFEGELKTEKEKGFRVDRLVEQFLAFINSHDLGGFRDLWSHLSSRYFSRLDSGRQTSAHRLETSLLKLYLVSCVQSRHADKVKEFFERLTPEIQGMSEWKEWFALPFLKNPEETPAFAPFFSRTWQDTLILSLFNFLSILFSCLPPPRLAEFQNTSLKLRKLREDNEAMRRKILSITTQRSFSKEGSEDLPFKAAMSPPHVMDDFYIIAQEAPIHAASSNSTTSKSLKNFLKNFTATVPQQQQQQSKLPQQGSPNNGSSSRKQRSSSKSRHVPVRRVSGSLPPSSSSDLNDLMSDALKEPLPGGLAYLPLSHGEFVEHRSEVTQVQFSSSGQMIVSGDVDGIIKVWSPSPEDPQTHSTFISPSGISALGWVGNSEKNFIYGTKCGLIRLCDIVDRTSIVDFQSGSKRESAAVLHLTSSWSGSVFAASSANGGFYIYDVKLGKMKTDFGVIPNISCSAFNHNTNLSITGGLDGNVRVYDLRKNDCVSSWGVRDTSSPVSSLQLSTDENSLYVLTQDGHFSQWSLAQTGSKLSEEALQDSYFNEDIYPRSSWGKQFALMGKHLLCCSISGGVIYEKTPSLVKVLGLKGHESHATCVDWAGGGDGGGPCITADASGRIRGWTLLSR